MQEDENVIEFSFDIELFQLDSDIEYTSSEVQYLQNYIDILGDIVEPLPLRILLITKPYNEDHNEKTKIQVTFKCLKRVKH